MIDGLKPYPTYKDSGSPWLGHIPAHWDAPRLKTVFREVDRRSGTGLEPLLSLRMQQGLVDHHEMGGKPIPPSSLVNYKRTSPGEIVMNRMRAAAGLFGVTRKVGLVSPDYAVLRPRRSVVLPYFVHLFRTPSMMAILRLESRGLGTGESGFLRLYTERFGMIAAPTPPPDEQASIVRFLEHADRRIRKYIAAKQKLIKLLVEQKQAIIHHAVTAGLDASAPLRATTSTWFPEVPAHWQVVTMNRVVTRAVDGPHHSPAYVDTGVPFLSARNVKVDRWSLDDAKFISEADYREFSRRVVPEVGDVLYTKGGTTGIARAVDLTFPFQVWVHIAVLKLRRDQVDPYFLAFSLNSPRCYEQSQLFTRGATNQDLGLGRMRQIEVPLPPINEQRRIVGWLEGAVRNVVSAITAAEREIALFREFRTRLVADVVTGRLDVRAVAAGLPDEPTQPEPLELDDGAGDEVDPDAERPAEDDAA